MIPAAFRNESISWTKMARKLEKDTKKSKTISNGQESMSFLNFAEANRAVDQTGNQPLHDPYDNHDVERPLDIVPKGYFRNSRSMRFLKIAPIAIVSIKPEINASIQAVSRIKTV
jgi:hypothetical protein